MRTTKSAQGRAVIYASQASVGAAPVARVLTTRNLDRADGQDWPGSPGMHRGLTRLRDGRYVVIISSDWPGSRDYGYIVSPRQALLEIASSGNRALLDEPRFAPLRAELERLDEPAGE